MAKLLTTKGSSAALEDIIRTAKKEIYLISFSFQISDKFITRIKSASERGVIVHLVYGKKIDNSQNLENIDNLDIYYCENLHAKIYANESACIIGSMNLYEYSELNNIEVGVLLDNKNDLEAYEEAIDECRQIIKVSSSIRKKPINTNIFNRTREPINLRPNQAKRTNARPTGYCIRNGVQIPFNWNKPFCKNAYDDWSIWNNGEYEENFCHFSGAPSNGKTCFNRPVLYENFELALETHGN